jgi:hypothetical protein
MIADLLIRHGTRERAVVVLTIALTTLGPVEGKLSI